MSTSSPAVTDVGSSTVKPGESKDFIYVGEQIPNQVLVQNLDTTQQANFVMQGVNGSEFQWRLFCVLKAGETVSLWVSWPTEARFTNQGMFQEQHRGGRRRHLPQGERGQLLTPRHRGNGDSTERRG
jgi:hypothetical protein